MPFLRQQMEAFILDYFKNSMTYQQNFQNIAHIQEIYFLAQRYKEMLSYQSKTPQEVFK